MRTDCLAYEEQILEARPHRLRGLRNGPAEIGLISAAALLIAVGTLTLANAYASAVQKTSVAARPVWMKIIQPIALFDVSAPALANAPLRYQAWRNRIGGGRKDMLTFGRLNGPTPYLQLQLYRVGRERAPLAPLYVALASAAAEAGFTNERSFAPLGMATRFGRFEVASMIVAQPKTPPASCLGFRGAGLGGTFRISGFACGKDGKALSRPGLGCLLDRLDLNEAGDDSALAAFFAASELRRTPACAGLRLGPAA